MMLRKACGKSQMESLYPHPPLAFWQFFKHGLVISQAHPAACQERYLYQRQMLLAQQRATDSTLIIQGRRNPPTAGCWCGSFS